jgi:hypothetical protein
MNLNQSAAQPHSILKTLAEVNGHVSIQDGLATLPDGTSLALTGAALTTYAVEVCRTAYANVTITVTATDPSTAAERALELPGNESFSEHASDYTVENVCTQGRPVAYK